MTLVNTQVKNTTGNTRKPNRGKKLPPKQISPHMQHQHINKTHFKTTRIIKKMLKTDGNPLLNLHMSVI